MKSIPIVVIKEGVQASSQNRSKRHDFPTPAQILEFSTRLRSAVALLFTGVANEKELDKGVRNHGEGSGVAAKHTLIRKS